MRIERYWRLVGLGACLFGCGSSSPGPRAAPSGAPEPVFPAQRFFPLQHDTVYAFATSNEETGERGVLMLHVTSPRAGRFDLEVGGRVQRLETRTDGIAYTTGGYVLKGSLSEGSTWQGHAGHVTVESVDVQAQVPAGKFVGCIRTVEEATSRGASKKITSVYCPDVGLVSLDVESASDEGFSRERAELQSFGPRVDLAAMTE